MRDTIARVWLPGLLVVMGGCANVGWLTMGLAKGFHGDGDREEFPDVNMVFVHPGRPYFARPDKEAAHTLAIGRLAPNIQFTVVAEAGEELGVDLDAVLEISLANVRTIAADFRSGDATPVRIAGEPALRVSGVGRVRKQTLRVDLRVMTRNGFVYQFITEGPDVDRLEVERAADEMCGRFQLLDPARVSQKVKAQRYAAFHSDRLGYDVDLGARAWSTFPDLHQEIAEADTGALAPDGKGGFAVLALAHGTLRPRLDALVHMAAAALGFRAGDGAVQPLGEARGRLPGPLVQDFRAERTHDTGKTWRYRMRLESHEDHAVITWVWRRGKDPGIDALADEVLAAVTVRAPAMADVDSLPEDARHRQAMLLNQVGLHHHQARQYAVACPYFERAHRLFPAAAVYLGNALDCHNGARSHAAGLALFEGASAELRAESDLRSWYAWHLAGAGRAPEAVALFAELLAAGRRDDDDLVRYTALLEDLRRTDEAATAWEGYLALNPSVPLRLRQSAFLYRTKRHVEAIAMLDRQLRTGFDAEVAYARLAHLLAAGRTTDVLAAVDDLVARGYESAETWFWRGRAEHALKWYRKARSSFAKAAELAPGDDDYAEWLAHVTGQLGEGNNQEAREALPAVELPPALREQMDRAARQQLPRDRGAAYAWRVDALQFERGRTERLTSYRRVVVTDDSGVARFATLSFQFNPGAERVFVNELRVLDAAGQEVARGNVDDSYVMDTPAEGQATEDRTLHVPVPRLAPGSALEYVVTWQSRGSVTRARWRSFAAAVPRPTALAAFFLQAAPGELRVDAPGLPPPVALDNGALYALERPGVVADEPWEALADDPYPALFVADARGDWAALGREYLATVQDVLKDDAEAATVARELARPAAGAAARTEAVWTHVQRKVTYRALEFGVRGRMPVAGARTLSQGYGDCKDHAVLLHQMLRAIAVPSQLVLVNTRWDVRPGLPSLDQFNHVILFLPDGHGGGRFLDPTDKEFDLSMAVPTGLAGRRALVLADPPRLVQLPAYGAQDSSVVVERAVALRDAGAMDVKETVTLRGYAANFMRATLRGKDAESQKRWFQGVAGDHAPGLSVVGAAARGVENNRAPLVLEVAYGRARTESNADHWSVTLPLVWERYYGWTPSVGERRSKFEVPYPLGLHARTTVSAAPGLRVVHEGPPAEDARAGSADCRVVHQPGAGGVEVQLDCTLRAGVFPAAAWADHAGTLERATRAAGGRLRAEHAP